MERHRAQASSSKRPSSRASAHSLPSSDFEIPHMPSNWEPSDASSLDVDADGDGSDAPRISAATREWWDRLGERDGPDA
jgi:hypothetical protein